MTEKVTIMVLKVDLQCSCCYKKVKKTLCKFPQIRDQVYDEKANTVTIKVVCCSPEKIRDKLCCKGAKAIKSIEIKDSGSKPKEPEKPKVPAQPKEPEKPKVVVIEKPKEPEKPKVAVIEKPKEAEKPKEPQKPKVVSFEEPKKPEKPKEAEKPKSNGGGDKPMSNGPPSAQKPNDGPKPEQPKMPQPAQNPPKMAEPVMMNPPPKMAEPAPAPAPAQGFPSIFPPPPCYGPYYEGYGGMPCYQGYAMQPAQQPMYDGGYYGHDQYGHGRGQHVTRCDYYFNEENPQACSIM